MDEFTFNCMSTYIEVDIGQCLRNTFPIAKIIPFNVFFAIRFKSKALREKMILKRTLGSTETSLSSRTNVVGGSQVKRSRLQSVPFGILPALSLFVVHPRSQLMKRNCAAFLFFFSPPPLRICFFPSSFYYGEAVMD